MYNALPYGVFPFNRTGFDSLFSFFILFSFQIRNLFIFEGCFLAFSILSYPAVKPHQLPTFPRSIVDVCLLYACSQLNFSAKI